MATNIHSNVSAQERWEASIFEATEPKVVVACDCSDSECRGHQSTADDNTACGRGVETTGDSLFRRVDMAPDSSPLAFCDPCAADAIESGLFVSLAELARDI